MIATDLAFPDGLVDFRASFWVGIHAPVTLRLCSRGSSSELCVLGVLGLHLRYIQFTA